MKNSLRNTFLNIFRLRQYYIPLMLLCFVCSAVGVFVIELFRGALLLSEVSYLPYKDYYLISYIDESSVVPTDTTSLGIGGYIIEETLHYFENTEDTMLSELCSADARLRYFRKDMSVSENESGKLPWKVVPESAYDDSFRTSERVLVSGRHILSGDTNAALIDKELAEINGIKVGDTFTAQNDTVYTVVGLYQTLGVNSVINDSLDVPNNMIFTSTEPDGAKTIDTYNLYVSFRYPYSEEDVKRLEDRITELMTNGDSTYDVRYAMTSVDKINRDSGKGVSSMLRLSVCCIVIMCVTLFIALYSFISAFYRKRQKEFILCNAIGKKKSRISLDFCTELIFAVVPSAVIGALVSNLFFLRLLRDIILYFEKMVSAETIHSTSTLTLYKSASISEGLTDRLQMNYFAADSALFLLCFLLIACICMLSICRASRKWSVMKMFSEK